MTDGNDTKHQTTQGATPAERILHGMEALIQYRKTGRIHYTQDSRRMTIVRDHLVPPFGKKVIYEDCSSMATGLYRMSGLHDPNNLHYSGWGYTGTLCEHGRAVATTKPRIGDLVFYGPGKPWHHVAVVYALNPTRVFSHGHEGGPLIAALDYRSDRGQIRRYF